MANHRWWRLVLITALCFLMGAALTITSVAAVSAQKTIEQANEVLNEMSTQEDMPTMGALLKRAHGVAIFPKVIKAALGFGVGHGDGLALRRDPATGHWYGPGFYEISGISWGAQIGISSTALILVITNEQGMRIFNGEKVTLGGEFAVAAGPVGRNFKAGTDTRLEAEIYSYSLSKGLFIGFSVEGSKIDDVLNFNRVYWGKDLAPATILAEKRADDARMQTIIQLLNKMIAQARAD